MLQVSATPRIKHYSFQQLEHNSPHTQVKILPLLLTFYRRKEICFI